MRDFNRRPKFDGNRDFKRRDFDRPQEMHQAVCSNCGKNCEVPFKPSGAKPVFCRECFQNNRTGGSDNFGRRNNYEDRQDRPNRAIEQPNYSQQFESLNNKLDKILNLLAVKEPAAEVEPVQTPEVKVPVLKKKKVSKK